MDFDWPGVRNGNHFMRGHGAQTLRCGATDHFAAVRIAERPRHTLV
jgi:hypothetical protein